jgi:hypothetical protein
VFVAKGQQLFERRTGFWRSLFFQARGKFLWAGGIHSMLVNRCPAYQTAP